jgi:hypothetical protein
MLCKRLHFPFYLHKEEDPLNSPVFQQQIARKFPPDYRKEIILLIMERIQKGDSCFIVGMSGTGKSNLFRCLCSQESKERYLAGQPDNYAFIWADTNALAGELSAFHLYELILYNLQKWAEESGQPDLVAFIEDLHEKVALSQSHVLAQRHLETILRRLFNHRENFHLILLFDEFEPIARELNFQFFKNLRWLRDEFKYRLSYIMAAHRMPMAIREEFFVQGEPFYELVASNILGLKPYNSDDTKFMITELSSRYKVELSPIQRVLIEKVSGGHGGLVAAVFKISKNHSLPHQEELVFQQLLGYDAVAGECRKIWNSLEAQEQDALLQLAKGGPGIDNPLPWDNLIAKGVIVNDKSGQVALFSPLFERFLATLV